MRPIDADEFLEKLDHSPLIQDAMRKAFDHMPTIEPEQRWIPCSERLPEKKGLYLSTTLNRDVFCDYWNGINFDRTELVIA